MKGFKEIFIEIKKKCLWAMPLYILEASLTLFIKMVMTENEEHHMTAFINILMHDRQIRYRKKQTSWILPLMQENSNII